MGGGGGGYSLQWPIRGDSTRKGYLFQVSGTYEWVAISPFEAYAITMYKKDLKRLTGALHGCEKVEKTC